MKSSDNFISGLFVIVFILLTDISLSGQQLEYLDPKQPVEKRVDDLLSRMTLEEKIGQLNMPCVYDHHFGKDIEGQIDSCRKFSAGTLEPGIGPGGGLFSMRDIIGPEGARRQAELNNEFQKIAVEGTRLRIPHIMID
jgi:beta-glucosidase